MRLPKDWYLDGHQDGPTRVHDGDSMMSMALWRSGCGDGARYTARFTMHNGHDGMPDVVLLVCRRETPKAAIVAIEALAVKAGLVEPREEP